MNEVRRENVLYLEEDGSTFKYVGSSRAVLLHEIGMRRFVDFALLSTNVEWMVLLRNGKGVSQKMIDRWIVDCKNTIAGSPTCADRTLESCESIS